MHARTIKPKANYSLPSLSFQIGRNPVGSLKHPKENQSVIYPTHPRVRNLTGPEAARLLLQLETFSLALHRVLDLQKEEKLPGSRFRSFLAEYRVIVGCGTRRLLPMVRPSTLASRCKTSCWLYREGFWNMLDRCLQRKDNQRNAENTKSPKVVALWL